MKPWFLADSLPRLGRVQALAGIMMMEVVEVSGRSVKWIFWSWFDENDQEMIADELESDIVDEDSNYIDHLDKEAILTTAGNRMHCFSLRLSMAWVIH